MTFDSLLQLHLDGTLTGADQAELFHILAVSDEKRAIFNEHSRLRAAISSDRAASQVPTALSDRTLFSALGNRPIPAPPPMVRTSTGVLVSALVAAGLMLGGVVGYSIGTSQQQPSSLAVSTPVAAVTPTTTAAAAALPSTGAELHSALVVNIHTNHEVAQVATRAYQVSASNVVALTNIPSEVFAESPVRSAPTAPLVTEKIVYVPQSGTHDVIFSSRTNGMESPRAMTEEAKPFEVELTEGMHVAQNTLNTAGLPTQPTFSLFRLSAGANISEHVSAGVLVGQNLFALHYTEQVASNTQRIVSQFTTQIYGGAYAKYTFPSISGFTPIAQVGAAWSSYGPVAEMELGITRPVFNNVAIILGVHGDMLYYQASGAWFNSKTASMMMGIGLGL